MCIVCVLTWSLLGVKKSLGHAWIGLFLGFHSKFPTSIPIPFLCGVPPGSLCSFPLHKRKRMSPSSNMQDEDISFRTKRSSKISISLNSSEKSGFRKKNSLRWLRRYPLRRLLTTHNRKSSSLSRTKIKATRM